MRLRIALAAVTAVIAYPAAAQAPTVKSGVEAWQRGDHAEAAAIWRNLAVKGDADAAFDLGQAYRLGKGVPADTSQAKRWFELAANKGHLDAQVSLGLLLFDSGDRAGAMSWLRKAAERGEPRALLVVGTALFNGDGVKQDPVLGYAYVSRAAAQGLGPAQSTLAEMDKVMSLADRQRGVAMALKMAKAPPPKAAAKSAAAEPAQAKPGATSQGRRAPEKAMAAQTNVGKGTYRVQLGAFSTKGAAQALFAKLQGKLGGTVAPSYIAIGAMTRLQVGPYPDKAAAAVACARLKPQACFVVPVR